MTDADEDFNNSTYDAFTRYLAEILTNIGMRHGNTFDERLTYLDETEISYDSVETIDDIIYLKFVYTPMIKTGNDGYNLFIDSLFDKTTNEPWLKRLKLIHRGYCSPGKPKIKDSRIKIKIIFNEIYKMHVYIPMRCYKHIPRLFDAYRKTRDEIIAEKQRKGIDIVEKLKKEVDENNC